MRSFVLLLVLTACPAFAQQPCLHGPDSTPDQTARRRAALTFVRAVNTAEHVSRQKGEQKFVPLADVKLTVALPDGFEPQFTTDGTSYALILKDKTDPCGFVFTTNQAGVIFRGYPIDWEVQPVKR